MIRAIVAIRMEPPPRPTTRPTIRRTFVPETHSYCKAEFVLIVPVLHALVAVHVYVDAFTSA